MARDGGGGRGSPAAERRRVALRALLASGAEAARAPTSKGLLRGLRCTSAAASQAIAPETPRPPADWRGLGCAAASQAHAHAPAAAADWRGLGCAAGAAAAQAHAPRRAEERRERRRRRKARGGGVSGGGGAGVSLGGGDVWCTPGVPFAAEASSVDCVVAPHQTVGTRRRAETDRPRRERPGAPPARRVTMREHMSSSPLSSPPHHGHGMPFIDADRAPYAGRIRHMSARRHSHARVDEEMMFRTRMLLGRMGIYDQYQDWRLDVDNMTYEELLDLEDRIGYVSTGLREDEIAQSIRMVRCSAFNPKHFPAEVDRRCSICQEEFEADEETGKLSCGHGYHVQCIKQWLSRKNACPVCKTAVSKT